MIKAQDVLDLLPEATSPYDLMVQAMDQIPASKLPRGYEQVVDLIAQTLNGGFEQYISNDYLSDLDTAISFLKQLGPVSKDAASRLLRLKDTALDFETLIGEENPDEDSWDSLTNDLEQWDDWLYANDRDDKIAGEMLAYLKDKKILPEAVIAGRQLASQSDKSKYASIKKQLDDIDAQKKIQHDVISKSSDDAARNAAWDKLDALKVKAIALDKVRREMLSKYRGLRSST